MGYIQNGFHLSFLELLCFLKVIILKSRIVNYTVFHTMKKRNPFNFGRNIDEFKKHGYMWGTQAGRWRLLFALSITTFTGLCYFVAGWKFDLDNHPKLKALTSRSKKDLSQEQKLSISQERRKRLLEKLETIDDVNVTAHTIRPEKD